MLKEIKIEGNRVTAIIIVGGNNYEYSIRLFDNGVARSDNSITYTLLACIFCKKKKYGKRPFIRHLANFTFIVILLSIIYLTFGTILIDGFVPEHHHLNLLPFIWVKEINEIGIKETAIQVLINVLMVIPLGFILPVVFKSFRKCWKTLLCIVSFILFIEVLQYFIGRYADIDDLILNTAGGLIGYGVFAILDKILKNKTFWKKANNVIVSN